MAFVIGGPGRPTVSDALANLVRDAERVSIAVSYIQLSGWKVLADILVGFDTRNLRIVCTDQMGVTDPRAVQRAIDAGCQIRNFAGGVIYHPKVFLAERSGQPAKFIVGSSNLSYSALNTSVEVNIADSNSGELIIWFDDLFQHQSVAFNAQQLQAMRTAFALRLKGQINIAKRLRPTLPQTTVSAEIVDNLFAALPSEVITLNFDQAANNVRTLQFAHDVLNLAPWNSKQRSEMNLLGFAAGGSINVLGAAAANAQNIDEVAVIWTRWLKHADDHVLAGVGKTARLPRAKRAFNNFWALRPDVTAYYLANSYNPPTSIRGTLQVIELLASAGGFGRSLSLPEVEALVPMLSELNSLSPEMSKRIRDYLGNKGTRGWDVQDRRILLQAWRDA